MSEISNLVRDYMGLVDEEKKCKKQTGMLRQSKKNIEGNLISEMSGANLKVIRFLSGNADIKLMSKQTKKQGTTAKTIEDLLRKNGIEDPIIQKIIDELKTPIPLDDTKYEIKVVPIKKVAEKDSAQATIE